MKLTARLAVGLGATLLFLTTILATAASADPLNDPDYWVSYFGASHCVKHETPSDTPHGYETETGVILNPIQPAWGSYWAGLVIKAGTGRTIVELPVAGVEYPSPEGKEVSHWIVCKASEEPPPSTTTSTTTSTTIPVTTTTSSTLPPSTTTPPTTTTTVTTAPPSTTSTTDPPTTTTPSTTTTSEPPASSTTTAPPTTVTVTTDPPPVTTTTRPPELPHTGTETTTLAIAGALMLIAGAAAVKRSNIDS